MEVVLCRRYPGERENTNQNSIQTRINIELSSFLWHSIHRVIREVGDPEATVLFNGVILCAWLRLPRPLRTDQGRVAILPFLDMKKLQKRLDLSQPWSSPKNLVFIETVVAESGYKFDEAWDSKNNKKVLKRMPQLYRNPRDPADSTSPVDVVYQASKPLPELGGIYKDGYHVGFADGSWGFIPLTLEKQVARTPMTVADGEPKTRMSFRDFTL